jgi:hypothetical protein
VTSGELVGSDAVILCPLGLAPVFGAHSGHFACRRLLNTISSAQSMAGFPG